MSSDTTILQPIVITLNGTCSVGKSTLADEMAKQFENGVVVRCDTVALEVFYSIVCENKYLIPHDAPRDLLTFIFKTIPTIDIDAFCKKINEEMYRQVRQHIDDGKVVINENAWVSQEEMDECGRELRGCNIVRVFVHSSLDSIFERVIKRNREKEEVEHRVITLPFKFFSEMYRVTKTKIDSFVDTLNTHTVTNLMEKLRTEFERVKDSYHRHWYQEAEEFFSSEESFRNHFHLDMQEQVEITPKLPFDYCVDTSKKTAEECASQVVKQVRRLGMTRSLS